MTSKISTSITFLMMLIFLGLASGLYALPLSGTYSVGGAGADFPSLQTALNQLNSEGQSASVRFDLNAGTYEGPFLVSRPSSEHDLIITAYGDAEVNLVNPYSSSENNYILKINNNSKILISKLKFQPSGTYARCIAVHGNSDEIRFQNNVFQGAVANTSWNNEAISFFPDGSSDSDDISFELNSFVGGGNHIYSYPNSSLTLQSNWTFWANAHTGGSGAIYLKQVSGISILAALINDSTSGIILDQCGGNLEIQRCNVLARTIGISLVNSNFTASSTPQIFNNLVKMNGYNAYNPNYDSDAYAISVNGVSNLFLAHNSVDNMSQTAASTSLGLSGTNLVAKNNNLLASGSGIALYLYSASSATLEHNNLFSKHLSLAKIGNTYYKSLAEYTLVAGGINYNFDPLFDDQLKTLSPWLDNLGLPCGTTNDYHNLPRDPDTPDIGAHEYSSDPANTPLSGTLSVGQNQDYPTLSGLFDVLSLRGINGDLMIELSDSLYTEQISITAIPGSSDHSIVIKPQSRTQATLRFSGQTVADNYLLKLQRSSLLSFQNLRFETLSSVYSNLIVFEGYNYYPRFLFCEFNAPANASGYSIVTPYGSQTPYLDVLASVFNGNNTGVYHYGANSTFGSNSFHGQGTGLSLYQSDSCSIAGNGFQDCSAYSIQINGGKSLSILRNTSQGSSTGIYVSNLELNGNQRNLIANNAVKVSGGNMRYGISLGGSGINLINNSFWVTGTHSFGLYCYQPGSNLDIVNNIFVSEQAHAVEFTYFSYAADRVIDYNCYSSPANYLARFGSYYMSLAELQAALPEHNQHSISYNPLLSADLHTQSPWLRRAGIFRSEISTDMDNEPRGEYFDIGADQQTGEYGFTPLSGTYNIGLGGQYPTLQDFLSELNILGASSSVTARLLPGIHSGYVEINDFPRISNNHYLTITAQPGASLQIDPQFNSQENYIFKLIGVDRLIFDGLSLSSTVSQNQSYFILLSGKCDDIKVLNSGFNLGDGYNFGIYAANSINDGLWIQNCQFTGGNLAVSLQGSGYTSDLYNAIRLEGNSFSSCRYPLEISRASDVQLIGNSFVDLSSGLSLSYIYGNSDIIRNRIVNHNEMGAYASMTLFGMDNLIGSPETEIEIVANIIYSANNRLQALAGLSLSNSSHVRLYHNTISVENSYSHDYGAAYSQSNCSNLVQINNIFASLRTGYAVQTSNCSQNYFGYNAYFGGGKNLLKVDANLYEPLLGIAALADANGVFANPYVDANGYTTANYLGNKGAVSYVQSDINYVVFGSNIPLGASYIAYLEPLSGSIQIGSDFPDLSSALSAAMLRGIYGSTALNLPAGNYTVSCYLDYIPNTLQNSFSLNGSTGTVFSNSASSEAENYILKLHNQRNLNIYGISFAPFSGTYSRCVVLDGYNNGLLIQDCSFAAPENTNTSDSGSAIFAANEAYDNLTVSRCQFNNFAFGINISGNYSNNIANGLLIEKNTLHNSYTAITALYANAARIEDNLITAYRSRGAYLAYGKGDLQVLRNQISGSGSNAFYLTQQSEGSPLFANNYMTNANLNGNSTLVLESTNGCKMFFNTLLNFSNYNSSAAFYQSGGVSALQFINNLCTATNGKAAVLQNPGTISNLDHNLFYSSLAEDALLNGSPVNSLGQWTALTGDATCVFADPLLAGDAYRLLPASPAINAGTGLAGFAYDLEGNLREIPDLGCYEYNSSFLDSPTNLQLSYDDATEELVLSWNPVSGASAYLVYNSDNPEMLNAVFSTTNQTVLRMPVSQGHRFFRVSAVN